MSGICTRPLGPEQRGASGTWRNVLAAVVLLFAVLGPRSLAQTSSTGALGGQVTDSKGGSVAGASIKITNESTSDTTTVVSQANGSFFVPPLRPGRYKLEVTKSGFKTLARTGITVIVTETAQVSLQIDVGLVTETIEVNAQ